MRIAIDKYRNYGIYTNTQKMMPSKIDGLLPVHKKVLFVLHSIAKGSYVKTATAIGELIGKYHPHAEAVGPFAWAVSNDFAVGGGQWGSNIGISSTPPAAARYTEIKASSFIETMAMKLINDVEWEKNDIEFDEPKFIPTLYPFCFIGNVELSSVGFGVKCDIPLYKKEDLCKRLLFLLNKTDKNIIIKPIIPNCDILSTKNDFKELLTTGATSITIKGKYTEDKKNNAIYIHGWSPRNNFEVIYKRIMNYKGYDFKEDSITYVDESNDKNGNKIKFEVSKQRNVSEIYDHMKKAIDNALTSNVRYCIYTYTDDRCEQTSVDELLLNCHSHYTNCFKINCQRNINKLKEQLNEIIVIKKIKPHISQLSTKKSIDVILQELSKLTNIDIEIIKDITSKYTIRKLLSFNTDETELNEKLNEYKNMLKEFEKYVLLDYKNSLTM